MLPAMTFRIEVEQEQGGRWIAEVLELPGAMTYGPTKDEAIARAKALTLRAMAERLDHGEAGPNLADIAFRAT
jgi:predicted RNase H-like HicB family nuclease